MKRASIAALLACAAACGGGGKAAAPAPGVSAVPAEVEACLSQTVDESKWSEIPLSDLGGRVYGIDFGQNSVQIYVEIDAASVAAERDSILKAEVEVGNTAPADRVILHASGNVLVSWSSEPTAEQRDIVQRCAGFA